ncbi:ubiquitin family protein [Necator americanus]|uniref:Ubiquitin family protein n=1 Tax=Necator americanus TaxID=51031 RepID=W2TAS3_NECAM|nr:ubiquitin family protein [Necator americanus]ETN78117.1 ubiquitin family protein [Necator americanus]
MQFTAKLLGGKDELATFELLPEVQVRHLKRKIADELLLPCGSFKVLNAGKPLHDDDLHLVAAGLKDGAKLTVVLNTGDSSDLNPKEQSHLKTILGESATHLSMLRLQRSIQNYVDFMSLDDIERFARKKN